MTDKTIRRNSRDLFTRRASIFQISWLLFSSFERICTRTFHQRFFYASRTCIEVQFSVSRVIVNHVLANTAASLFSQARNSEWKNGNVEVTCDWWRKWNDDANGECKFARRYPARNDAGQIDRTSSRAPRCLAGAGARSRNNNYIVTRRERSRSSVDRERSLEASIGTRFVSARDRSCPPL